MKMGVPVGHSLSPVKSEQQAQYCPPRQSNGRPGTDHAVSRVFPTGRDDHQFPTDPPAQEENGQNKKQRNHFYC